MSSGLSSVLEGLREPADALLDPSRRVFWPALAGAGLMAAAMLVAQGVAWTRLPGRLFTPRIWLHRSARLDYQLIIAKMLLRAAVFGSVGVSALTVAANTAGWLRHHFGVVGSLGVAPRWLGLVFTLCAFLVEDWSRYSMHRLMHRIPLLWEFHKVHHSAEVLTPFTLYRTHPIEALLNGVRGALAVGLVSGVFAWLFSPALRVWELLGVEAIGFIWTLLGANLRHSHVWVSYGRWLEHLLVSPAQHQVHHSCDPRHSDRNFGTVLAVWDWLGGSLYTTEKREWLRFGLSTKQNEHNDVVALLGEPIFAVARQAARWLHRRLVATTMLVGICLLSVGCESKRLDRAVLLQSFGQCTLDTYRQVQTTADRLVTATETLATSTTPATQNGARAAWEQTIDAWQVAELLQYGPAGAFDTLGGKGLRETIYAWPDVNRCLIEQQLVSKAYEGAAFASTATSTRGLGALEYLLFYAGTDNACSATADINTSGSWAALTQPELASRKAAYARAAAVDLAAKTRALIAAWEPNGFLAQLTTAGRGSTLFATQQAAISVVAEALFVLDTEVKDRKLAMPLGLRDCASTICPEALESPWADRGKQHLRNNLLGIRLLLEGCPAGMGLGYDDLLEAVGAPALATEMRADLLAAATAIDALPGDKLSQTLTSDRASVQRVYDTIKELTDFLKMEFSMALVISSKRVEGDHD